MSRNRQETVGSFRTKSPYAARTFLLLGAAAVCAFSVTVSSSPCSAANECLVAVHEEGLRVALEFAPAGIRERLSEHAETLVGTVRPAHRRAGYDPYTDARWRYERAYREFVEEQGRDADSFGARQAELMGLVTTELFFTLLPIRQWQWCWAPEVLAGAGFHYDGFDGAPPYDELPEGFFAPRESSLRRSLNPKTDMRRFFNVFVNEIIDVWIHMWLSAGFDISTNDTGCRVMVPREPAGLLVTFTPEDLRGVAEGCLEERQYETALRVFAVVAETEAFRREGLYGLGRAQYYLEDLDAALRNVRQAGDLEDSLYFQGLIHARKSEQSADITDKLEELRHGAEPLREYVRREGSRTQEAQEVLRGIAARAEGIVAEEMRRRLPGILEQLRHRAGVRPGRDLDDLDAGLGLLLRLEQVREEVSFIATGTAGDVPRGYGADLRNAAEERQRMRRGREAAGDGRPMAKRKTDEPVRAVSLPEKEEGAQQGSVEREPPAMRGTGWEAAREHERRTRWEDHLAAIRDMSLDCQDAHLQSLATESNRIRVVNWARTRAREAVASEGEPMQNRQTYYVNLMNNAGSEEWYREHARLEDVRTILVFIDILGMRCAATVLIDDHPFAVVYGVVPNEDGTGYRSFVDWVPD